MTLPLLLATFLLGQEAEIRPATQKWAEWLRTHTGIATTREWTRTTWRDDPKSVTDPGFFSPTGDRLLTLDGRIVPYVSFRPQPGTFFLLGPEPLRPDGEATVAVLLAQGRQEDAFALAKAVQPEEARGEISRAVQMHAMRRYSQAAWRFERGEDRGALLVARDLLRDLPSLKAVALETVAGSVGDWRPLQSLDPLPHLVADLERREREPKTSSEFDPKTASVDALIERLDEISNGFSFSGGRPSYQYDPVVKALATKGNEAVQALMNVLEADERLTRDVSGHDHSDSVTISPVSRPAAEALDLIAGTRGVPGVRDQGDLKADAAAYRRFFEATAGFSREQRAITLLREDIASWVWVEAAEGLTSPTIPSRLQGRNDGANVLRASDRLSVEERAEAVALLDRRISELRRIYAQDGVANTMASLAIARALIQSDGAEPLLKAATDGSLAALRVEGRRHSGGSEVGRAFRVRLRRGDPGALAEYESWIKLISVRAEPRWLQRQWLAPLADLDTTPALEPIARWVLDSPESPFRQEHYQTLTGWDGIWYDRIGPLPRLFRAAFVRELNNRSEAGRATREADGQLKIAFPDGSVWSQGGNLRDADLPVGASQTIRRCDVLATNLGQGRRSEMPLSLAWSLRRRDAAIRKMSARLRSESEATGL